MANLLLSESLIEKASVFAVVCCALAVGTSAGALATAGTSFAAVLGASGLRKILPGRPECETAFRDVCRKLPRQFQMANEVEPTVVEGAKAAFEAALDDGKLFSAEGLRAALAEESEVAEALSAYALASLARSDPFREEGAARDLAKWLLPQAFGAALGSCERFRGLAILTLDEVILAVSRDTNRKVRAIAGQMTKAEEAAEARHREQMAATDALRLEMAREKGVDPAILAPLFEHLGQQDLTIDEMRVRAAEAVAEMIARSKRRVEPSNEGQDIDATIGAAREKLAGLDTAGARSLLSAKIAEEEEARRQRLVPLLEERAAIERLGYDYESAKATLRQLLALHPDAVWSWIELGELFVTTGSLGQALAAFHQAEGAALRTGDERDLSVSYERIGDVLVAQGNLPEALKAFRDGLAIRDRLAKADPGNAGWQRDLSVSYDRIGDVLVAQGNLPEALKAFHQSHEIFDRLAKADPGNAGWQVDLGVSNAKLGQLSEAAGDKAGACQFFRAAQKQFDAVVKIAPDWAEAKRMAALAARDAARVCGG